MTATRLTLCLFLVLSACDATDTTTAAHTPDVTDTTDIGGDTSTPTPRADLAWAFDTNGPYQTGHRALEISYTPMGLDAPRNLTLHIWYPTKETTGEPTSHLDLFVWDDIFDDASLAPPVAADAGYPVHVHSHGNVMFAGHAPELMKRFASHGWVVVGPDHTGNTMNDLNADRPTSIFWLRAADISASLDALESLDPADPLAGQLALDRVVMSGHSFGGYTTVGCAGATFDLTTLEAGCAGGSGPGDDGTCAETDLAAFAAGSRDPRIIAAIPMAGGNSSLYGVEGLSHIEIPILMMHGSEDPGHAQGADDLWTALPAGDGHLRLDIEGGCHATFNLGACADLSDEEGHRIVTSYSFAYARQQLLGDDAEATAALLNGSTDFSEAATLTTK